MIRIASSLFVALLLVCGSALAGPLAPQNVWTTAEASVTRFMERDSAELQKVSSGEKLRVVFTEGDRIRVRLPGSVFGWVDAALVTDQDPAAAGETAEP